LIQQGVYYNNKEYLMNGEHNDNQWKVLTGLASGVMGLYLGMDILYKRLKG
jgi:hypothetical protein